MRRWIWKSVRIAGITLGTLFLIGLIYQPLATAVDARRFPAPGTLVDVGGYRLHINCEGYGSPTVVLEAGLGGSSLDWSLVMPVLARQTRVCVYDRAGYGWSDPGPAPRTSARAAEELHTLLIRAGEPGPYVLAAHALGGLNARLFADRYPGETVGLVLVDPTTDGTVPGSPVSRRLLASLSHLSLPRLLAATGLRPGIEAQLPEAVRGEYRAVSSSTRYFDALYAESAAMERSLAEARQAKLAPNLPLVEVRPADRSGPYVQIDNPPVVLNAISEVIGSARRVR